jgi:lactam utilization protein B
MQAQSICIHGDNPSAIAILKAIDAKLEENGVSKASF